MKPQTQHARAEKKRKSLNLKASIIGMVIGLLVALFATPASAANYKTEVAESNGKTPAVFYIPHPDDEILSFGVALLNHVWTGSEVKVVLLTHGRATNVYKVLVGEAYDYTMKKWHDPTAEGYAPFTRDDIGDARIKEFVHAMNIIGISPEDIEVRDFGDADVTVEEVKGVMMEYENKYPGARHKTFSYYDNHQDHANAGKALNELYNEGKVKDARFYVKNSQYADGSFPIMDQLRTEHYDPEWYPFLEAAVQTYSLWKPEIGRFAVGNHSVPRSFDLLLENPISKYHLPNQ